MPTTYPAGELTKRKILKESRKLFYKNGFPETSYDDISKAAKVNRALIPYYFKSKLNLGIKIFEMIIADYNEACKKLFPKDISIELKTSLNMFAYYRLLKNQQFARFAKQIQCAEAFSETMIISEKKFFEEIVHKKNLLSNKQYDILANMDYGIEKEIIRMASMNPDADIDEMTSIELNIILGYFGYSKKEVGQIIADSLEILDGLNLNIKDKFNIEASLKSEQPVREKKALSAKSV